MSAGGGALETEGVVDVEEGALRNVTTVCAGNPGWQESDFSCYLADPRDEEIAVLLL